MNIKYVSLLSLIFVASFSLNNTMMAMAYKLTRKEKELEESMYRAHRNILSEMLKIDQKLVTLNKDVRIEHDCLKQQKVEKDTLYFWQPYTVDCTKNSKEKKYHNNIAQYTLFKSNFRRCKRLDDIVCFKDLEEELYEWNKNN